MQKLFLFAIGGTGERVLRATTMLLAAGVPAFNDYEVYPIIIDYDQSNGDKSRLVRLLKTYNELHTAAYQAHGTPGGSAPQFCAAPVKNLPGLTNYLFPFDPEVVQQTFRKHIGYDALSGDTLRTKDLLHSLYDESNRSDTELNLKMDKGFKGNPNIGSVVFHDISATAEFQAFLSQYNPAGGDKAIVIGSLFGGTGAAGIPEIVKAITKARKTVATILVLPYFAPTHSSNNDAIQSSRFNSKTKAALSYYHDSQLNDKIDAIYYVGDPYPTTIPYSDGGDKQQNNASVIELIAAMMIEHYVSGRGNGNKEFKFSLATNIAVSQGKTSASRLYLSDFDDNSRSLLRHLALLAIAEKFFHEEIYSTNLAKKDFYQYLSLATAVGNTHSIGGDVPPLVTLCQALETFYGEYQQWLCELDYGGDGGAITGHSHRVALFDMEKSYRDLVFIRPKDDGSSGNTSMSGAVSSFFKGSSSLDADYLAARMNFHIKDNGNDQGHYDAKKNALRDNHQCEWVLMDILHKAADDGLTNKLKM